MWGEIGIGAGREGSGGRGKAIEEGGTMGWTEGNQDRGVGEGSGEGKWGKKGGERNGGKEGGELENE